MFDARINWTAAVLGQKRDIHVIFLQQELTYRPKLRRIGLMHENDLLLHKGQPP